MLHLLCMNTTTKSMHGGLLLSVPRETVLIKRMRSDPSKECVQFSGDIPLWAYDGKKQLRPTLTSAFPLMTQHESINMTSK